MGIILPNYMGIIIKHYKDPVSSNGKSIHFFNFHNLYAIMEGVFKDFVYLPLLGQMIQWNVTNMF